MSASVSDSLLSASFFFDLFTAGSLTFISAFFGDFFAAGFFFDLPVSLVAFGDASSFDLGVSAFLPFGVAACLAFFALAGVLAASFFAFLGGLGGEGGCSSLADDSISSSASLESFELSSSIVSLELGLLIGLFEPFASLLLVFVGFFLASLGFFAFLSTAFVLGLGHRQNSSILSMMPSLVPLFSRQRMPQMNLRSFSVFLITIVRNY